MSTVSTDRAAPALTGSLGTGSIVFMVVAAAAPLTVVSGTVPLSRWATEPPSPPRS
ncbi:hypothetical protein [Streptomyces mirabilis]|uniref:hypothetical protein n=1 Tax=Streptomyces mirabilis TaxID=68239 RepID=UPI003656009F